VLKLLELYEEELGLLGAEASNGLMRIETSRGSRNRALARCSAGAFAQLGLLPLLQLLAPEEQRSALGARTHAAVGRHLAQTLGELKGVAMKLGQLLGHADFGLPGAAQEELRSLLISSRPLSPARVAQTFLEELGVTPRQLFGEWSPTPFAAASIGQVHRARLSSGEEVAVKVQYPAIADAIRSDLASAALLERLSSLLFRGQEPGAFLAEVRERFAEECDYRLEAERQERFRRWWLGRPGVLIPRVFPELCTRRILVSELRSGESFDSFLHHASQPERDRAGQLIAQFAFESIFRHGVFNADPHPGNYLFEDGNVVFLDFGCVKEFAPELLARWKRLMRSTLGSDLEQAQQLWIEIGMVPWPERYDFRYHQHMMQTLYEPWLQVPFRFTPEFVTRLWRVMMVDNPNRFCTNNPKDWVFVNRLQWGLYAVLARLQACADFRSPILALLREPEQASSGAATSKATPS
jgi:predicted unusual protein kinase regulating ubiquinone biosynthesis (AarF/ABC1/UbiB family)